MSRLGWRTFFIGLLFALALLPGAAGEAAGLPDREPGVRLVSYVPQWLVGFWEWITETDPNGSGGTTDGTAGSPPPTTSQGSSGDVGYQTDPNG